MPFEKIQSIVGAPFWNDYQHFDVLEKGTNTLSTALAHHVYNPVLGTWQISAPRGKPKNEVDI